MKDERLHPDSVWTITGPSVFSERRMPLHPVRCRCGTERLVRACALKSGHSRGCGCSSRKVKHRMSYSAEFAAWRAIRTRCYNKNDKSYARYGGRGITVCDRWRESFENFFADMGPRPSARHSIDRINNDGNYEPGNCRWATIREQNRNKRNIKLTASTVARIRQEYATGTSQAALGQKYGVRASTIGHVVKRKTWKDVA